MPVGSKSNVPHWRVFKKILNAVTGAAEIGHGQTTVQAALARIANPDYYAGTTTAKMQAALDSGEATYLKSGTYNVTGLSMNLNARRISGCGINTWIKGTGAHTLTGAVGSNDSVLEHVWIDQADVSGAFDAVHLDASEWHIFAVDIDFSPQHGVYIGGYRTQVSHLQAQYVQGDLIHVIPTAYRCTFSDVILENAGTGTPGNLLNLQADRCAASNLIANTIGGYMASVAGSYNVVVNGTGILCGNGCGVVAGAFNAIGNLIAKGTTGRGFDISGGSNTALGLVSDNSTLEALRVSGNSNVVSGRFYNAGVGGSSNAVELTGQRNIFEGVVGTQTGAYNLKTSGNNNHIAGDYAGAVHIESSKNTFHGGCQSMLVSGDGTAADARNNVIDAVIEGGAGVALEVGGVGNVIRAVVENAGTQVALISGADNIVTIKGFGASGTGIEVSGSGNDLTVHISGSAGDDLVISGDNCTVRGRIAGDVTISGDQCVMDAVIGGNLTLTEASQNCRISGVCIGTVTDSGTGNNTANLT